MFDRLVRDLADSVEDMGEHFFYSFKNGMTENPVIHDVFFTQDGADRCAAKAAKRKRRPEASYERAPHEAWYQEPTSRPQWEDTRQYYYPEYRHGERAHWGVAAPSASYASAGWL